MRLNQAEICVLAVPAWPGEVRGCPGAHTLQLLGWDGSSKPCSQLRHGLKQTLCPGSCARGDRDRSRAGSPRRSTPGTQTPRESLHLLQAAQLQPSGHQTFPPTNLLLRPTPPPCFGETNEVPGARLGARLIPTRGAERAQQHPAGHRAPPAWSPRVPGGLTQPVSLRAMEQPLTLHVSCHGVS